jgi:3-oxoacyl-[acyl-carrier protein] reductase
MVALLAPPTVEAKFDDPQWTQESLDATLGSYFADRDPKKTFAAIELATLKEER